MVSSCPIMAINRLNASKEMGWSGVEGGII